MDEKELDARNTIEQMLKKTKEVQMRYSQESLFTMEAQSKMINKALMSQHEQWVLGEWQKFLDQIGKQKGNSPIRKLDIFARLRQDACNQVSKRKALQQLNEYSPSPAHQLSSLQVDSIRKNLISCKNVPQIVNLDKYEKSQLNIQKFLADGGRVRDIFSKIQYSSLQSANSQSASTQNQAQ